MAGTTIYRSAVATEWIDYNGHLRDAYYVLILSLATDGLMDHLGLDAAYRERTRCTLFSLEMHMHWLREVKDSDLMEVDAHLLAADAKRLHVGFDIRVVGRQGAAATAEFVLLHYRQGENPGAATFPPEIVATVAALGASSGGSDWPGPRSRALTLARRA